MGRGWGITFGDGDGDGDKSCPRRIRKICYDLVNEYQVKYSDRQDTIPMDLQVPSMEDVHEHDTMDPLCVTKDILAVPISTVAFETAFSTGGQHLSPQRNRLNPKTLEALICAQDWLWTTMEGSTSSPLYSIKEETIKDDEDPSFVKYDT
ncbi:hypothetical protein Dsin_008651 [Dipteronia sinensis]|uniref:HAT C-terminal dimerisation domain-containing protein n=1 Tax=Dipteronia sinensis TaxID=43782 RepID=A0AAE0AP37_9ROSI|nr:hypothetical protein Dsin_008651 [Dipteronia sinensis]